MTRIQTLIAAVLLALGLAGGWALRDITADRDLAAKELEIQQERASAMRIGLAHAHRAQEALDAEHLRSLDIQASRAAAVLAGQRLRDELQATRTWARGLDSSIAGERAAAIEAIDLLTGLLDRCSEERRTLADFADRAANAGQTCVDAWPQK